MLFNFYEIETRKLKNPSKRGVFDLYGLIYKENITFSI